jgi:hypothetical protein
MPDSSDRVTPDRDPSDHPGPVPRADLLVVEDNDELAASLPKVCPRTTVFGGPLTDTMGWSKPWDVCLI